MDERIESGVYRHLGRQGKQSQERFLAYSEAENIDLHRGIRVRQIVNRIRYHRCRVYAIAE